MICNLKYQRPSSGADTQIPNILINVLNVYITLNKNNEKLNLIFWLGFHEYSEAEKQKPRSHLKRSGGYIKRIYLSAQFSVPDFKICLNEFYNSLIFLFPVACY